MTSRAVSFLIASFIFYFFANQTQIGWVFVLSVVLLVVVIIGYSLNRGILRGVQISRNLQADATYHENDALSITLALSTKRGGVPQAQVTEQCPLADPLSEEYKIQMYIPYLNQEGVTFSYSFLIYRRGLHTFVPIQVMSRAPFGFFKRTQAFAQETTVLVYPLVKPLAHLALLDRQPVANMSYPKAGMGNEVMGVRDFRSGDSPRHIHWRSVARKGVLISKEFAEETQEGLTLFVDRYAPYDNLLSKHTPFEMGIKCAVSVAEYALRQRFSLFLSAYDVDFAIPTQATTWDYVLQYMARVPAYDQPHLYEILARTHVQQFVAVVLVWADERVIEPLIALKRRGVNILVVAMDTLSFPNMPANSPAMRPLADALQALGIEVKLVAHGDEWDNILGS